MMKSYDEGEEEKWPLSFLCHTILPYCVLIQAILGKVCGSCSDSMRGGLFFFFSINASKIYCSPRQQRPDISAGTLKTKSPATCRGEVGEGVQPDLKEKINLVLLFEFWFPLVRFGGQG